VIERPSQKIWTYRGNNQKDKFIDNIGNPDVGTVKLG
jgi:hypothetical protein